MKQPQHQQYNNQAQAEQFQPLQRRQSLASPSQNGDTRRVVYGDSPHSSINGDARPPTVTGPMKRYLHGMLSQKSSNSVKSLNNYYDSDSNSNK
jgi:hypothetical protein